MNWIVEHWPYVLGAAVALLSALNAWVVAHPDQVSGKVVHVLAVLLDLLSFLWSRDASKAVGGLLGWLKLPGQLSPPSTSAAATRARVASIKRR